MTPEADPCRAAPLAVRAATFADVAVLSALHKACLDADWSAGFLASLLAQPGTAAMLAVSGADVAGFALYRCGGETGEVLSLGVLPLWRRSGVGRQLLNALLDQMHGAREVVLEVAEDNHAARALYAGARFSEIGRRRGYYRTRGASGALARDALVLALRRF